MGETERDTDCEGERQKQTDRRNEMMTKILPVCRLAGQATLTPLETRFHGDAFPPEELLHGRMSINMQPRFQLILPLHAHTSATHIIDDTHTHTHARTRAHTHTHTHGGGS